MKLKANSRIGVLGKTGYGKTYFMDWLTQRFLDAGIDVHAFNTNFETLRCHGSKGKLYIFNPPDAARNTSIAHLNRWIIMKRAEVSNAVLRIEDLDAFFNEGNVSGESAGEVKNLFDSGRHQGLGVLYGSKTLKYMPLKLFGNTDLLYFGQFTEADDCRRAARIGIPEDAIMALNNYVFVQFDRSTNDRNERLKYVRVPQL